MTIAKRIIQAVLAGALALGVSTAALADKQGRNTIIGAGLGGAAGALISDGDPWVILGGAAAGGVLGHVITDDDDRGRNRHHWKHDRSYNKYYKRANYRGHDKHRGGKHWHKKHHRH
ncbi:glycine zipper 2TM domain-containing protein [Paracandidimonas soli]|uniref:Glycine zipper 2TM protein n=2 Tax=Paracandidimonas soli TaxID=1917182 RepID=A0A4R3V4H8_9BURK|nr:glycine zipper 2TM domain-containing protein [Paracandidimonas soli]TCU97214.1 hypothetical protein EV686_10694 [Paracandidimonas soli]